MLWNWDSSNTQVFILDLDGTLMPSAKIDDECFWQAVFACFGHRHTSPDLHEFKCVTDAGILDEWCKRELGRPPRVVEIRQIKRDFVELLKSAAPDSPQSFKALPGVFRWFEAIHGTNGVFAGIATGGWQCSARLKLQLSGLDRFDLPLASSDDAVERSDIMQVAVSRTLLHPPAKNAVFTYIGDGTWDLQASQKLNWNFIGIASGERAQQLRQAGANHILADFDKSVSSSN